MRHFLGLLLCACLCLASLPTIVSSAATLLLGMKDFSQSEAHLNVSRSSPELTTISLETPTVVTEEHVVDYQAYQTFGIPGEPFVPEEGSPAVPQVFRFYRIPNTGSAELVVTDAEYDVVDNVNVFPYQRDEAGFTPFRRNGAVYETDGWYPQNIAVLSDPMIMRDFRIVGVTLYPVQVNPVTHQARIYRNIRVDVVANNRPGVNEILNPRRPSGSWAPMYRHLIANLDDSALDDVTTTPGSYLIICKPDPVNVNPFVDSLMVWKTRKGYKVIIDSRANWTRDMMTTAIHTYYANQDPPLEYVCLIGDPYISGGGGTTWGVPSGADNYWDPAGDFDHIFALGNTGDDIEDVGVGRLSGRTSSEMAVINAKIMGYERNPHLQNSQGQADTLWFRKAFLYAGVDRGVASNYTLMQWTGSQFKQWSDVDSVDILSHASDPDDGVVHTKINNGVGFYFWRGTWVTEVHEGQAVGANAGWRLPICLVITCSAGNYIGADGMSERFLTAGSTSNPQGGVCGIGSTTSNTHNPENISFTGGFVYSLLNMNMYHLGDAMAAGKAWLYATFGTNTSQPFAAQFSRYNNLMGDPALAVWTEVPKVLDVTHPASIDVGTHQVQVVVHRAADNAPVEDVLVCLWKRGADSTWVRGTTDANGAVVLPVSINSTGTLYLTVTKQNHKPYLYDIPCGQAEVMAMYSSCTIDDDNTGGTQGNGNHGLNPAETIDLPVYIRNFGNSAGATGVSATLSSNNPHVTVLTGTSTYPNIAAGDSALGVTPFRIHSVPAMQDGERVLLTLTVTTAQGTNSGAIELVCHSATAEYVSQSLSPAFDPGATSSLQVTIHNSSLIGMTGVTGELTSLSPYVQVLDAQGSFGDIAANGQATNSGDVFSLNANPLTFRGHQAPMRLVLTTSTGAVDTVQFVVSVGTAIGADPTGPDAYGYFAYDNTDVSYSMHPAYQYMNITSTGQNLNLHDTGDKSMITQIWSAMRPLPFGFKFYGQVYDTVTICSNGWMAFGNQAWYDVFRNYPIPAMQAPNSMIAPYWDDLVTDPSPTYGVWAYHDADSGRYIVQWKATGRSGGNLDFEVILYDTLRWPTMDGNGKILIQYNQVTMDLLHPDWDEVSGCSIGIQNQRGDVGLSYAYRADYAPGAATVSSGRAILFTTEANFLVGQIMGLVTDSATHQPIPHAVLTVDGYGYRAIADSSGHYHLWNVLIGTYTARAAAYRYNDATVANVAVTEGDTTWVNLSLPHPQMVLSTTAIEDSVRNEPHEVTFTISNTGNGPLDYNTSISYTGDPSPWDSVGAINAAQVTGDNQLWGCEFLNDQWWVTGAGDGPGQSRLYRFDLYGNLIGWIPQPSTTSTGWFDLATDGTLLYGSDGSTIYGIDVQGQVIDTISCPLNPARALAYDPQNQYFWMADYTSDIYVVDRSGTLIRQIANTNGLSISGLAWYAADPNGYKLYIFSRDGSNQTRVTRMRPTPPFTQETVTDLHGQAGDRAAGCTITPSWNSTLLVFGGIVRNNSGSRLAIHEMEFNSSWMDVTPAATTIPGGGDQVVTLSFDPQTLRNATYRVNLHIASVLYDSTMTLPVTLVVWHEVAADEAPAEIPAQYALKQNYPNPFNPTTQIAFDLPKAGHVELRIYNSLGQKVATLLDEMRSAGSYTVIWDGRTNSGADVSTGVYFYQIRAGSFTSVKKMLLMR